MTSQGHAVSRFARAIKTGNPNIVVPAAAELPRLSLVDALLVLLVFARARAPQTEAAAVRWAGRYVAEVRPAPEARELTSSSALPARSPVRAPRRGGKRFTPYRHAVVWSSCAGHLRSGGRPGCDRVVPSFRRSRIGQAFGYALQHPQE